MASPSSPTACRPAAASPRSTSMTAPSRPSRWRASRSSRRSTTPRPLPARTTRATCSAASSSAWRHSRRTTSLGALLALTPARRAEGGTVGEIGRSGGSEARAAAEAADGATPGSPRVGVEVRHLHALAGWAVGLFLFFHFFPAFELLALCLLGSAILAAALQPLAYRIPAKRWPSAVLAGLVPILGAAALFWLVGWLVWRVVHEQAGQWPALQASIDEMLAGWSRRLGLGEPLSVDTLRDRLAAVLTGRGREIGRAHVCT